MKVFATRSIVKRVLIKLILLSMCLYLSACLSKVDNRTLPVINGKEVTTPAPSSPTPLLVQQIETPAPVKTEKVVESWEEFEVSRLPLISSIPDKNIYLYGIKPEGVVLYVGERGHYYNWAYLTPRFVLPRMHVSDFDADTKDELAVITYVGSGTGYAVEELHMIEMSEEEMLPGKNPEDGFGDPNPEYFKDYFYKPDDYLSQLKKSVKLKTFTESGELMADIKAGDQSYKVSLKNLQSEECGKISNSAYFGDIVHFNAEDGKLTAQFALGVICQSFATPWYIGDLYADVSYKAGKFALSNFRFEEYKEN